MNIKSTQTQLVHGAKQEGNTVKTYCGVVILAIKQSRWFEVTEDEMDCPYCKEGLKKLQTSGA